MSASRLLILGVLRYKQVAHGYEIRRELELWGAEKWANIAYGSIYHALNQMSKEELIRPIVHHDRDLVNNRPSKTSYALTESGESEFHRLLREFWWEPKSTVDPFQVALALMPGMERDELLAALKHRAGHLRQQIENSERIAENLRRTLPDGSAESEISRHVAETKLLAAYHYRAELLWVEQATEKVQRDELP